MLLILIDDDAVSVLIIVFVHVMFDNQHFNIIKYTYRCHTSCSMCCRVFSLQFRMRQNKEICKRQTKREATRTNTNKNGNSNGKIYENIKSFDESCCF